MFVQIIEGTVSDADLLARQTERWATEIKPHVTGYLGSTSGVTSDRRSVVIARFESAEAAAANSASAQQDAWWNETVKAYDREPTFRDCSDVDLLLDGGSNDARFVQVISGRAKDPAGMRRMLREHEDVLRRERPEILGGLVAWHGDGTFTQVVYFRSEEQARQGEQADSELATRYRDAIDGVPTFYDLADPRLD